MREADRKVIYRIVWNEETHRWVAAEEEKEPEKPDFTEEFKKKLP